MKVETLNNNSTFLKYISYFIGVQLVFRTMTYTLGEILTPKRRFCRHLLRNSSTSHPFPGIAATGKAGSITVFFISNYLLTFLYGFFLLPRKIFYLKESKNDLLLVKITLRKNI